MELRNNGRIVFDKSTIRFNKTPTVTYNQLFSLYDSTFVVGIDAQFTGEAVYFAVNNSATNTPTVNLDFCKVYVNTTSSFASNITGVWNMYLTNNAMPLTNINNTNTTIAPSSLNTIDGQVIETLNEYPSKASAVIAGLKKGAKFINVVNMVATSITIGVEYKILTLGTTNFTSIGAPSNTVGLYFTATGVGTGTGTVSLIKTDIVN